MASIIEKYNIIYKKIKAISDEIQQTKEKIATLQDESITSIPARITHLEEQLKKIDEYLLKVQAFRQLAEKHISSKNVLTIETPPNYRVNLNRLRKWAMMIDPKEKLDPSESDDPYAQKVYLVATCDEFFLKNKKKEFSDKIAALREQEASETATELSRLKKRLIDLEEDADKFANSGEFLGFLQEVVELNKNFWFEKAPATYVNAEKNVEMFSPGAFALTLPGMERHKECLKEQLGKFYDAEGGRILLPVEIPLDKEFVLTVSCAPSKDKSLDKGIQNIILNIVNNCSAGMQKVYVIDGVRFNASSLGTLRQMENTFAIERIPRNSEQLTDALEKIVSTFADVDEKIGDYDSVKAYNSGVADEQKIALTTVVLYGWPSAYTGRNRELLLKIMTNYERYGISFITVDYKKKEGLNEEVKSSLPEYATHNAIHVRVFPNDCTIELPDRKAQKFVWYVFNDSPSEEYISALKKFTVRKNVIGSEYIKRYSLENIPPYEKGKKSIALPFGVDAKDQAHSISFDNENFASYLMGASGSGKSTLLHTLITGIIRNYHPDDVELWLADFKMSEFAQYMDPMPPHIKYILLDESPELVYDLIDKLTEKMMERQKFFMRHRDLKKVENVKDTYMPVILVMLDEFSIMSQAIAESQTYKLKLQNLLAKGRALGIKFVFASQDFTKGIGGLTATARDQIQSRIAMKNSYSEIDQTLELSVNMKTEQVKNWMEAIPPYYALMKYRDGEQVRVKRVNVMYFRGSGGSAYEPQRNMIKYLCESMKETTKYNARNPYEYVAKNPVVVDGNTFHKFDEKEIMKKIISNKLNVEMSGDEMFAFAGTPRLMTPYKEIIITPESRQNFLLLCESGEMNCGASVVTSISKCFEMQHYKVSIWAYDRNKVLKVARNTVWKNVEIISDLEEICMQIKKAKEELQSGENLSGRCIVLLGFENVCADFELLTGENAKSYVSKKKNPTQEMMSSVMIDTSKEDEESSKMRQLFMESLFFEDEDEDEDEFIDPSDIEKAFAQNVVDYAEMNKLSGDAKEADKTNDNPVEEIKQEKNNPFENVKEDLKYIVQHGSRKGVHFLLYLNSYADLKQTGLKDDFFRHRLAFRIPAEDSKILFNSGAATLLPDHICLYSDRLDRFSFRPYLHSALSWDGWGIDENGDVINPLN